MTIIDRFHPQRRDTLQAAADASHALEIDEMTLMNQQQMIPLTMFSLLLLILGGVFFIALNLIAYTWRTGLHGTTLSGGAVLLWLLINILSYLLILPIHELLHGLTISLWGGKPYYGTKLPLALFCSAKNQLFPRNYYAVIALVPLVVITLAGIVFTLLAPALSPYVLLATAGNVSGAAGDLWMAWRLRKLPAAAFVEDLETGDRAWEITLLPTDATMEPGQ